MAENTLNLYQRIRAVMQDVEYLAKDDSVGSGSYAYKAISEEKVTQTVRASLIKNGLVIFPIDQVHTQKDHVRDGGKVVPISTVDVKYKIVNIDKPTEFEILASSGTGVDPQDKGVGKAMTYSYKYLFLRTFAIPTGEDPDKVHNNDLDKQQKPIATPAPNPANEPATGKQKATLTTADKLPPIEYASAVQRETIIRLLNHPLITKEEKTKMLLNLNKLDKERAISIIEKLQTAIEEREEQNKSTAA